MTYCKYKIQSYDFCGLEALSLLIRALPLTRVPQSHSLPLSRVNSFNPKFCYQLTNLGRWRNLVGRPAVFFYLHIYTRTISRPGSRQATGTGRNRCTMPPGGILGKRAQAEFADAARIPLHIGDSAQRRHRPSAWPVT